MGVKMGTRLLTKTVVTVAILVLIMCMTNLVALAAHAMPPEPPMPPSAVLQFSSTTYTGVEGHDVTVTLNIANDSPGWTTPSVWVHATQNSHAGDYNTTPATITGPGTCTVTIPTFSDNIAGTAAGPVSLTLYVENGGLGPQATATIALTDDGNNGLMFGFSASSYSLTEASGTGTTVTVTKTGMLPDITSSVKYALAYSNGTALTGGSGTLTFAPADTSEDIAIPAQAYDGVAADNHITVTLSSPTNAGITTASVPVNIVNTETTITIQLVAGWNLISFPLQPFDATLSKVFGDSNIAVVWAYDPSAGYNGGNGGHYVVDHVKYPGADTLTAPVDTNHGYWVYYNSGAGSITYVGHTGTPVLMNAGWNLVGHSGATIDNVSSTSYQNVGAVTIVWAWDETQQNYVPTNGGHWSNVAAYSSGNTNFPLRSGHGYWVLVNVPNVAIV